MSRLLLAMFLGGTLFVAPRPDAGEPRPPAEVILPVGWGKVEFANRVVEVCDVGNGGESSVEEPRSSEGRQ